LTIAGNVVDEANLKVSNNPVNGYMLTAQSGNSGGLTWAAAGGNTLVSVSASSGNFTNSNSADAITNAGNNVYYIVYTAPANMYFSGLKINLPITNKQITNTYFGFSVGFFVNGVTQQTVSMFTNVQNEVNSLVDASLLLNAATRSPSDNFMFPTGSIARPFGFTSVGYLASGQKLGIALGNFPSSVNYGTFSGASSGSLQFLKILA